MKFDYESLKSVAEKGLMIGTWKGKSVYACKRDDLWKKADDNYYIIYDDSNELVARNEVDARIYYYGYVDRTGTVHEDSSRGIYEHIREEKEKEKEEEEKREEVFGDVKLGIDVESTLKSARTLSINDLLKDFNYGL